MRPVDYATFYSAHRLQDQKRRWFNCYFNFARTFHLLIFARPKFVVEVKRRGFPNKFYLAKPAKGQWELDSPSRQARVEILHEDGTVLFPHTHEIQSAIFGRGLRCEIKYGAE